MQKKLTFHKKGGKNENGTGGEKKRLQLHLPQVGISLSVELKNKYMYSWNTTNNEMALFVFDSLS